MASAVEVANAYIALQVRMPGVKQDLERGLGGPDAQQVIQKRGKSMGAALTGAIAGAAAVATSKAVSLVTGSIDAAIKRVDTMRNFPKVMENLGYSSADASKSIQKMSDKLKGLPTSLDAMAGAVQQLAPLTGGLDEATDLSLALNNALLAGGKSTDIQKNAMEQYVQMLSVGKVDMAAWRSMVAAMPGQMNQLSESLLGAGSNSMDLYAAMQNGTVSFDQFNDAMLKLNEQGLPGYASFADQAKDATAGIATGMQNLQTAITRGLANLFDQFQPQITAALAAITEAVNVAFQVIGDAISWIAANSDWLMPLVVGVTAAVGAFKAWAAVTNAVKAAQLGYAAATYGATAATYASTAAEKVGAAVYAIKNSVLGKTIAAMRVNEALTLRSKIAIVASTAATQAATGAQNLFNAALKANPIGLIITAITALVAGLVWFFTQTELGKEIWSNVMDAIGKAAEWLWQNVLEPVFTAIGAIFTWLWENVLKPVVDFIVAYFKVWADSALWLWQNVLQPAFQGIGAVVEWLWTYILKPVIDFIVNYYRFWGAVAVWLWQNVLVPAFQGIGAVVEWVWTYVIKPVVDLIIASFRFWASVAMWLWQNAIDPAVSAIGRVFEWLYQHVVKPVFDGMSGVMRSAWEWIDAHVFGPFRHGIGLIGQAFENIASAIGHTWNGIRRAAAEPINFVLDVIWNHGLRSFWNDIVGELGLDDMKLPAASLISFASGGVMPGYTPGRDVHKFYSPTAGWLELSGGEAIMRPEFTRLMGGPQGIAELNRRARLGQAFKNGGVWNPLDFVGDVVDGLKNAAEVAWDFLTDPVGSVQKHIIDGLIKPLVGPDASGWLKMAAQLPIDLAKGLAEQLLGASPAAGVGGGEGMGWQKQWEIVSRQFPGITLNSAYRPGAVTVNGSPSYHGMGRAIDVTPRMDVFEWLRRTFPNSRELIYSPAGARQLYNGQPHFWGGAVRATHWDHVHWAMNKGGVLPRLYDSGGWLPHGGVAINQSGRPEAVLSPDEAAALRRGLPRTVQLVVGDREFTAYVREEADGQIAAREAAWDRRVRMGAMR